jgi:sec-independent protein translocase protein TatA
MEIAIVLIIALIVFGPKRLPELGKSLGKGIQEFKGTIGGDKHDEAAEAAAVKAAPAPVAVAPGPAAESAPAPKAGA